MSRLTEYGFDFGPLEVTRAMGDPKWGYAIHVKVGKRLFAIDATPHGRKVVVREHVGQNRWKTLRAPDREARS